MFQELALQVTQKAHAGQVDKAGKDYICILHGYRYRIGRCVFACCIRRYSVTVDELRNMFSNEIVDGIITLTHRKDESYFEYISMSIYIKVS